MCRHTSPVAHTGGSCAHCPSGWAAFLFLYEAGIANCRRSLALVSRGMFIKHNFRLGEKFPFKGRNAERERGSVCVCV